MSGLRSDECCWGMNATAGGVASHKSRCWWRGRGWRLALVLQIDAGEQHLRMGHLILEVEGNPMGERGTNGGGEEEGRATGRGWRQTAK